MDQDAKILKGELGKEHPDRAAVMHALAEIRKNNPIERNSYPDIENSRIISSWETYRAERDDAAKQERHSIRHSVKVAIIAVVCCLLICTAPSAFGAQSIFEILGTWTRERFAFLFPNSNSPGVQEEYIFKTDNPDLQQIYDAVTDLGVTQPVVPTWIPQGFELQQISTTAIRDGTCIEALLADGDTSITLSIRIYEDAGSASYYKEISDADMLEISGIRHYVLSNNREIIAAWVTDNLECCLSVCGKHDYFEKILSSIYKGEY